MTLLCDQDKGTVQSTQAMCDRQYLADHCVSRSVAHSKTKERGLPVIGSVSA